MLPGEIAAKTVVLLVIETAGSATALPTPLAGENYWDNGLAIT